MNISIPAIDEVIAHRGSMQLIDEIVACDAQACCARTTPRADAWYADADRAMPAWFGIELMAQAIAAWVHLNRPQDQPPKQGVLLGTRSYTADRSSFPAADALLVRAQVSYRDESGLGAFDCSIVREAQPAETVATATLKVFEPEDFQEFLKGKSA